VFKSRLQIFGAPAAASPCITCMGKGMHPMLDAGIGGGTHTLTDAEGAQ
jgi:hypothetical protein